MSDLVSQKVNMVFKSLKGETVHALKDITFTLKSGTLILNRKRKPYLRLVKK